MTSWIGSVREIMNPVCDDVFTPGPNEIRSAHAWFAKHVERLAGGRHDMEYSFKTVMGHSFFKGDERVDSHVGIGFGGHAEQEVRTVAKSRLAFVFNGSHGCEALDDAGVEVSHAGGAFRVNSLASCSESGPHSSWALASDARLREESGGWAMVLSDLAE